MCKWGEVFRIQNLTVFLFLGAVVNISIQTDVIFRQMIISQLELGPHVMEFEQKHYSICILLAKWFYNPIGEHHDTCFTYPFKQHSSKRSHRIESQIFKLNQYVAHALRCLRVMRWPSLNLPLHIVMHR